MFLNILEFSLWYMHNVKKKCNDIYFILGGISTVI